MSIYLIKGTILYNTLYHICFKFKSTQKEAFINFLVNDVKIHSLDDLTELFFALIKAGKNATLCTFVEDFGRLLESRLVAGIVTLAAMACEFPNPLPHPDPPPSPTRPRH